MDLKSPHNPDQSILYEINIAEPVAGNNSLAFAQKIAIDSKLPFAVIYFHPNKSVKLENKLVLGKLEELEHDLEKYNIPLMVFIGDRTDRLEGISIHLNPSTIYNNKAESSGNHTLAVHPITWPGVVFSTKVLRTRILSGV